MIPDSAPTPPPDARGSSSIDPVGSSGGGEATETSGRSSGDGRHRSPLDGRHRSPLDDWHRSPLDNWHRSHGATMVPFGGYQMPLHYGSILEEHHACRTAAALFDVSHMGRLRFEGEGAAELLDHLCTRRISDMPLGRSRYGLICNADGGVLDDVLVSHLETPSGKRLHLMVVNASNRAKLLRWIEPHLRDFPRVTMTDRTAGTAMFAVQGPAAVDAAARLFSFDVSRLSRYAAVVGSQFNKPVIVSRTGYTGEDGLEVIVRDDHAGRVWENLLLVGREAKFRAAGLAARDTLRMEAGMPLYGHELTEAIDPHTAGLSFAVTASHRHIGDDALAAVRDRGVRRRRIGLVVEGRRPVREGAKVFPAGRDESAVAIGSVTSGGPSPTAGHPIAMAYVDAEVAGDSIAEGERYEVDIRGSRTAARRVPLPFYRRGQ